MKNLLLLLTAFSHVALGKRSILTNEYVMIDMAQNNPGDHFGWQQSKYQDPSYLKKLGYSGQVLTGEMSGALAVDFSSTALDIFPKGSPSRSWIDAFATSVGRTLKRAAKVGVETYFFVDLLVFPAALLEAVPKMTSEDGKTVLWNHATKHYLKIMVQETFDKFDVDGWIVRTGETYVYDTPFHKGNSPSNGTMDRWVDFITTLREYVCVELGKKLFIRSWDSWPSDASYYLNMTSQIPQHELLYFSIKHTSGDFVRPSTWNPMLGVGEHAQIVEVELQREYESKGALPNYVMNGIIDGFAEMGSTKKGLSSIINSTQVRGLWTWSRGGGWWGPYLHGREWAIDLHAHVLTRWWAERGARSEEAVFMEVVPELFKGCDTIECVGAFRYLAQMSSDMVLRGQWGTEPSCGIWMRDDRMGGLDQLRCLDWAGDNETRWELSLQEKKDAFATASLIARTFDEDIRPHLTDPEMVETLWASCEYAKLLYNIVKVSWPLLHQAYNVAHNKTLPMRHNATVVAALESYDAAWAAYRAFGLSCFQAASLYHPYYLCLGTTCNGAFDPPDMDMQRSSIDGLNAYGIGHSIDGLRNMTFGSARESETIF